MATFFPPHVPLMQLKAIKQWHVEHREDHPVEYHLWDTMLTLWMLGWMGMLPAMVLDAQWTLPLCLSSMLAPNFYVFWRQRAHAAQRLRCDWLQR